MYRLLIVDDEEIEREGMAQFIDWQRFNVKITGTAWNGVEALEKIRAEQPDIILTDIKMPVMDGIELIKRTKENYPDIQFIVLSGYGEYEFTSQAMELGVRHYLLKPCDEEQIEVVLEKVKWELEKRREQYRKEKDYHEAVERLLPKAKKQIFRDMLLDPEYPDSGYEILKDREGHLPEMVSLLGFQTEKGFDYLEQFIISNILMELLGEENIYLSTTIDKKLYYLLSEKVKNTEKAAARILGEFKRIKPDPIWSVRSRQRMLGELTKTYKETEELLKIGKAEGISDLITYDVFETERKNAEGLVNYEKLRNAVDFAEVLSEIYLVFMKMGLKEYTFQQKYEIASWIVKIVGGTTISQISRKLDDEAADWELLVQTAGQIAKQKEVEFTDGKEEQRVKMILLATFKNIRNQELSIRYLAKEELFMNEDYLGRVFMKNRNQKFSAFLLEERIGLAQGIMQYDPELKIAKVAEMVGYSPDGQYFSKAFKKMAGCSPKEYKEKLQKKSDFCN